MNYKHGKKRSRVYNVWCHMKARCLNKRDRAYPNYGGRGIGVCERWLSFDAFFADMGDPPAEALLERINNNLGYSPENCVWATRTEQNRNKRDNRLLTIGTETLPVSEWAARSGIAYKTVHQRIRNGWPAFEAVFLPLVTVRKGVPRGAKLFGAQHGVVFGDEGEEAA